MFVIAIDPTLKSLKYFFRELWAQHQTVYSDTEYFCFFFVHKIVINSFYYLLAFILLIIFQWLEE